MPSGLTEDEVKFSREKHGRNCITQKKRQGFWRSFIASFGDPVIKILLAALAVNVLFIAQHANWFESVGIALAILLATLVSTLSEYGSESAFEKLQEEASKIQCRVQRASGLQEIPVDEIVVGDLILLQAGDRVPADGRMSQGQLEVDQSALNGESKEAKKRPVPLGIHDPVENSFLNPALVFSGTVVCAGEGIMEVTHVGDHTFYGHIGTEIQEETRESPLRHRLNGLAADIGKFGYIAATISVLAYLFNSIVIDNGFDLARINDMLSSWHFMLPLLIQACTLGVTVVVMAVPEGLPMMITVVLSANMRRMLKDHVLVRKLIGIETAGSLNILFSDKTGTLTSGKLEVVQFADGTGRLRSREQLTRQSTALCGILKDSIQYNCAAALEKQRAIGGNATDRAVMEFAGQLSGGHDHLEKFTLLPFSSQDKMMITAVSKGWNAILVKGAPEKILPHCTHYYDETGEACVFTSRFAVERMLKDFTEKAMRVIVIAVAPPKTHTPAQLKDLTLVGLLAIRDDIRPQTLSGVAQVQRAGVQTVMITGDSAATATAIAKELGLIQSPAHLVITSDQLKTMSDEKLTEILPDIRVIARALPSDKSRLVRVAQGRGFVVGMTGDGVNDAPALKLADIGFSMGSGTEVAKEASDIVIMDNRFDSIAKAICYGRTIFKSIRKFIIYQMSTCFCAVGVTIIGPLINVDFPITVIQMLWINMVMDTLSGLAFSGEKARQEYMDEAPKSRSEAIINPYMKNQIAVSSIYAIILCLAFLKSSYFSMMDSQSHLYSLTAFFALFMFCTIFRSFNARTHNFNIFSGICSNLSFLWIMGLITLAQMVILYYGGSIFRTIPLSLKDLITVVLLAFTVIPVDLLRKYCIRHSKYPQST
ncbi:calcium-translocating P-type ATPase, PMCA-type [Aminipila butyrica]|uniref:P-type Ca(2+) transporter n=2 Tax=Aminipila butyrica TaxID=433296 RepID=A0A858C0M7_9FIRM|nr:calcium-translocating P-type ATPase, PMCA-type [Aminipila butyrica]